MNNSVSLFHFVGEEQMVANCLQILNLERTKQVKWLSRSPKVTAIMAWFDDTAQLVLRKNCGCNLVA